MIEQRINKISEAILNGDWKPCYPGGKDTPEHGDHVLVVYYSHEPRGFFAFGDKPIVDLAIYLTGPSGGHYWSRERACDVHPLCWHAIPALPPFIESLIQEEMYKDIEDTPVSTYIDKKGAEHNEN